MICPPGKQNAWAGKPGFTRPVFPVMDRRVAVIEQSELQKFSLVILDLEGNEMLRVPSPGNRFIQHPAWMEGDTSLVVIMSDHTSK